MSSIPYQPLVQMAPKALRQEDYAGVLVPHSGYKDAKIIIVGEAPGWDEVQDRKPFVGRAGQILEQCFHVAGLARAELYLTNVVKIYTPGNDISSFWNEKNGLTEKGKVWRTRLIEELKEIDGDIIIALGNVALSALCDIPSGITKWRGSLLESPYINKKIIPSIHPASVNYGNFFARYYIVHDLKLAIKCIGKPRSSLLIDRNYIIKPSLEQSLDYLSDIYKERKLTAFDIEIGGGEVSCISFSNDPTEAISIPVMHYSPSEEAKVWRMIDKVLHSESIPKMGQYIIFDTQWLLAHNKIHVRGQLEDIQIAHHILYPDFPATLGFIISMQLEGEPYYKDEGKQYKLSRIKDWDQFWTYNCKDSTHALASWLALEPQIQERGYYETYRFTMDLFDPLNFMMLRGVDTDKIALETVKKVVSAKRDEAQKELNLLAGASLNTNSPKQVQAYFYGTLGIPPFTKYNRKTKKSTITTDDKSMQKMARGTKTREPVREAKLVQEIRGARKLIGTYLDVSVDKDGRFRCAYKPRGTTSGRLSSTKTLEGTGMNHQNLPRSFRTFMVPDPNHVFIEWDEVQAEWVVVAYLSGDARMIRIHEQGLDAHLISGGQISLLPEEYVELEYEYVGGSRDEGEIEARRLNLEADYSEWSRQSLKILHPNSFLPRTFSIRQVGKHSNHGFNYDMTAGRFASEYETSLDDAVIIHDRYFAGYPAIKQWHERVKEQLAKNRTLENFYGRKRRFLGEWGETLFKSAYDFIPQSTVVDLVNRGLLRLYSARLPWIKPLQIILQGHDSIMAQYPTDNIRYLALACVAGFEALDEEIEYLGRTFRINTDMKIGYNWRDMVKVEGPIDVNSFVRRLPKILEEAKDLHNDARKKDLENLEDLLKDEEGEYIENLP